VTEKTALTVEPITAFAGTVTETDCVTAVPEILIGLPGVAVTPVTTKEAAPFGAAMVAVTLTFEPGMPEAVRVLSEIVGGELMEIFRTAVAVAC
jgi:hypothetical protein